MKVFKLRLLITLLLSLNLLSSAYAQQLRGVNTSTLKGSEDVDALSAWNVNVIRYQLSMGEAVQTATPAEFLAWLSGELDTLDTLLPLLSSQGISVIIDMHSPPGGFASTQGFPLLSIFSSAESRQTLFDAWDAIASRYSGNSTIFAYELVSEPGTGVKGVNPEWSQLAAELVTAVLAVDANAKFIVAPDYAHFNKLKRVAKSLKNILGTDIYSQHIIHSVHLFFPDKYVNQGLGGKKIGVKYPSKRANKKILRERLKKIRRTQRMLKLPRLLIGEFSVARWAPGADKYLRNLVNFFERFKWDYTYHIFREFHSWDLERTEDPDSTAKATSDTARLTVMKSFFARNG